MQSITNIATQINTDPNTLLLSLFFGIIPSFLWLLFWLREDKEDPEPRGLIFLTFLSGMLAVILVLPIQRFINNIFYDENTLLILWVASEEFLKLVAVFAVAISVRHIKKPVGFPIYFMAGGLGFAALENALFLAYPIGINDPTVGLLTGNLRFLGATLLHSVASGMMGLMLGLAFFQNKFIKIIALLFGLFIAIALHTAFNFFIMKSAGGEVLKVFGFLWVVTIISMLVFEKLRRMSESLYMKNVVIHGPVNEPLLRR